MLMSMHHYVKVTLSPQFVNDSHITQLLTTDSGVLRDNGEVAVVVDESVTQSRSVCSDTTRLWLVHVELERTSIDGRSIVSDTQLVLTYFRRTKRNVHCSILVVDNSRLHLTSRRSCDLGCTVITVITSPPLTQTLCTPNFIHTNESSK